jgi:hypothetical protein
MVSNTPVHLLLAADIIKKTAESRCRIKPTPGIQATREVMIPKTEP